MIWARDGDLRENFIFDTSGMKKTEKFFGKGSLWIEEFSGARECQLKNSF